ncbi:MAG: hypothetical protein KIH08_15660 [Candidatus Freyarchaeota archaeon]|nr:hypothetical protein [Candidatus Jordarchaeia archaeon]MBS7270596.1 hypothetical protein [Candidatus Jordarchaeia archaeon]MBS7281448.1 hypothetical protein [Candidatus Jordarchaeia archaeon]
MPIVNLALRVGRRRARGPAIVNTDFDGGVYPNIEITILFKDTEPLIIVEFENPLYGRTEFEVFTAEAFLQYGRDYFSIGEVRVYVPIEAEHLTGEVLVGRDILNQFNALLLELQTKTLTMDL